MPIPRQIRGNRSSRAAAAERGDSILLAVAQPPRAILTELKQCSWYNIRSTHGNLLFSLLIYILSSILSLL